MDHASMDEAIASDRIAALLSQEKRYECPDYLSPDYMHKEQFPRLPRAPTMLRIVEECANIVTDLSLVSPTQSIHRTKSPSSVNTTAFVSSATQESWPDMEQCHVAKWRRQMCSWAYKAVDAFDLDRELVAVAFNMLDRYLATELKSDCAITREDFQLFCMTCLYTAVKILEPTRKFSIPALIDMSRGYYCAEDVLETEVEIIDALEWRLNPPTALCFVGELLASIQVPAEFMTCCRLYTEMAVMDEYFVPHKASTVAVAAVLTAARQHNYPTDEILARVDKWMDVNMNDATAICDYFVAKM